MEKVKISFEVGLLEKVLKYAAEESKTLNDLFHEFLEEYTSYAAEKPSMSSAEADERNAHYAKTALDWSRELQRVYKSVETSYDLLQDRAKAYGAHQPIKAWKYLAYDQCNPCSTTGDFEHMYKFVKKGTELYYLNGNKKRVPTAAEKALEVNIYGDVLDDKNFENKIGDKKLRRMVKDPREIYDLPNPILIFDYILRDWEGFIRDLRFGEFKYYSRSALDYISALSTKKGDPKSRGRLKFFKEDEIGKYENIGISYGFKGGQSPAFDTRALVVPGKMDYIGRRSYDQIIQHIKKDPKRYPYPALSSLGMSIYMPEVTRRDINDIEAAQHQISRFLRDTGVTLESPSDAGKAMGGLGEALKKEGS